MKRLMALAILAAFGFSTGSFASGKKDAKTAKTAVKKPSDKKGEHTEENHEEHPTTEGGH